MERTATGEMQFSLLKMTWPVFIELLLQMLVGNIDQIMLSHYNETAVAAVGNANQIMNTLILTFTVISLAATILFYGILGATPVLQLPAVWVGTVLKNFPMAFFWNMFAASPFTRWAFRRLFAVKG